MTNIKFPPNLEKIEIKYFFSHSNYELILKPILEKEILLSQKVKRFSFFPGVIELISATAKLLLEIVKENKKGRLF